MKKLGALISLIILLVGCTYSSGDYPHYNSLEEIESESDVIVLVHVEDIDHNRKIQVASKTSHMYHVASVEIMEVIKGDLEVGHVIEVKELAFEEMTKKVGYLSTDSEYILFLANYGEERPYSLVNPYQGKIEIIEDLLEINEDNNMPELVDMIGIEDLKESLNEILSPK